MSRTPDRTSAKGPPRRETAVASKSHAPARLARRRIALLLETSTRWGVGLATGVGAYVAENRMDWDLWIEPRGRTESLSLPTGWRPDGVIARVTSRALATALVGSRIPAVDVSWYRIDPAIPRCSIGERYAAGMAARYLADRGLRRFAYVGCPLRNASYVDRFGAEFAEWVGDRGWPIEMFPMEAWQGRRGHGPDDGLVRWIAKLDRPVGLLSFDTFTARRVAEACRTAGVEVPGGIAVLSGEHDSLVCDLVAPRLSSLDHSPELVGYRAARMLDDLLNGRPSGSVPVELPTAGVVTRESTDMLAIDDPILADAIRFIRQHACQGIDVADVATAVRASRRLLEQRFRKYFDRSPAAEIRRVKVERASKLLSAGDERLSTVARACGFDHAATLTRVFQHEMGVAPSAYRRRFQHHA